MKKNFINLNNKNKGEKYVIYTTLFQVKLFAKSKMIYIDATFMKSPKYYYQTLNIICYCQDTDSNIPVFFIPMSSKNIDLYIEIFNDILNICNLNKIRIVFKDTIFMCYFVKALRASITKFFKGVRLKWCYFHCVKC